MLCRDTTVLISVTSSLADVLDIALVYLRATSYNGISSLPTLP